MGAPLGSVIVPAIEADSCWLSSCGVFSRAFGSGNTVVKADEGNDGPAIQEGHPSCDAARGASSRRPTVIPRNAELEGVLKQRHRTKQSSPESSSGSPDVRLQRYGCFAALNWHKRVLSAKKNNFLLSRVYLLRQFGNQRVVIRGPSSLQRSLFLRVEGAVRNAFEWWPLRRSGGARRWTFHRHSRSGLCPRSNNCRR